MLLRMDLSPVRALILLLLATCGLLERAARAEEPLVPPVPPEPAAASEDPFAALQRRVEAVERDNAELRAAVDKATAKAESKDPLAMSGTWKNGLSFSTQAKDFQVHVGGRVQFDTAWFDAPENIQTDPTLSNRYADGVGFRRVRLKVDGKMYDFIEWAAQFDIVNSEKISGRAFDVPVPTDLWWTFTELPVVGNIRVGNQKEPIGFEHLVSSRFLPFMERSYNQDSFNGAFNNGFTPGISAYDTICDERGTFAIGLFKPTNNGYAAATSNGDYAVTSRLTWLPYYEDDGRELLHLGISGRLASAYDHTMRFRTRNAVRTGIPSNWPIPADTGTFFADNNDAVNFELVAVNGSWTFQSEYLAAFVTDAHTSTIDAGTVFYQGAYAQVLYYLTGEHDHYSRKSAVFERVVPKEDAFPGNSITRLICGGAWQVGARYNYLDLNSNGINGGILHDCTLGLNWFLNPNVKVQMNYSAMHRESPNRTGDGWVNSFGVRLAHDF